MTAIAPEPTPGTEREMKPHTPSTSALLSIEQLNELLRALASRGFTLIGPTARDGVIVFDEIASTKDLPAGRIDDQQPGRYRLDATPNAALFNTTVGHDSLKSLFFPSALRLFTARRNGGGLEFTPDDVRPPHLAVVGVRPCELAALAIRDRVLLQGPYRDPVYESRRNGTFIVAVNCTRAGGTCFCASMGTGPAATRGFDLALTELVDDTRHQFLVQAGSEAGISLLAAIPHSEADASTAARAEALVRETAAHMGRSFDTAGVRDLLYANAEHPRWDDVAKRCLACGNCTMVCPTCFCTTVEDVTDLAGERAERWRRWDSCFTLSFSYVVGGSIRRSAMSRYRQWLTHKLAAWQDQFGSSGCVGCGRCITWCPTGIDLTAEVAAIRSSSNVAAAPTPTEV